MAKQENDKNTTDLFPVIPEIKGLGVATFKMASHGSLEATLKGAVNVNDVAQLTRQSWQKAVAYWLVNLCANDVDIAMMQVKKAYVDIQNENGESHRETPIVTAGAVTIDVVDRKNGTRNRLREAA